MCHRWILSGNQSRPNVLLRTVDSVNAPPITLQTWIEISFLRHERDKWRKRVQNAEHRRYITCPTVSLMTNYHAACDGSAANRRPHQPTALRGSNIADSRLWNAECVFIAHWLLWISNRCRSWHFLRTNQQRIAEECEQNGTYVVSISVGFTETQISIIRFFFLLICGLLDE